MIDYVLDAVRGAGVGRIVVVIGHEGDRVKEALSDQPDVEFAWQHDPQGTGHAVMMCEQQLRGHAGTTLVLAGDTPLLKSDSLRALLFERKSRDAACVVGSAVTDNNFGLGRIVRDGAGEFVRIVEQKDASPDEQKITEINTGCYAFHTPDLLEALGKIDTNNQQGELYLTDCPSVMLRESKVVRAAPSLTIEESMGVNTRQQLADVRRVMHWENLQSLMQNGVGIMSPEHVDIDPRATIGADTVIHPFTVIEGPADIGSDCEIGPSAVVLGGCRVPPGTRIEPFTVYGQS